MAKDQKNKVEEAIEQQKQKYRDYQAVFGSGKGKKVLEDLEKRCYINRPTMSENIHHMAYREGMRAVVLHIKTMLAMDEEKANKLIKQQKGE